MPQEASNGRARAANGMDPIISERVKSDEAHGNARRHQDHQGTHAGKRMAAKKVMAPTALIRVLWKLCEDSQDPAPRTRTAFVPPKANEFDSIVRTATLLRATFGTKSRSHSGSGLRRCMVGKATECCIASNDSTASSAPAAPRRWGVQRLGR